MPYRIEEKEGDSLIVLETPEWSGIIDLDATGNLIRLTHRETGMEIFRFPASIAELHAAPAVYGIPLLLPPNRIRNGRFAIDGRQYMLPVNEKATNCHLHGLVLGRRWRLEYAKEADSVLRVQVSYLFDASRREFAGFPHEFSANICYELSREGLKHVVRIENLSSRPMPLGVGLHTAFSTPADESVTVKVPHRTDGFWTVHSKRRLPTGKMTTWPLQDAALLDGRLSVERMAFAHMFPLPECGGRNALLHRRNGTVCYEFDSAFTHLACWNDGGNKGFFCVEPMSWMTDAPNLSLSPKTSGFAQLSAGESRVFCSTIRLFPQKFSKPEGNKQEMNGLNAKQLMDYVKTKIENAKK